jgi:multidrug efflux pump subunit AcrB
MTGIGVISLAGVVVNNSIVLLDYIQKGRARGLAMRDALVEAGKVRLRPVLLTAITTIFGLLPMATGVNLNFRKLAVEIGSESSQWWNSLAVAVIFGLAFATVLTLVVVPTFYHAFYCRSEMKGLEGCRPGGSKDEE